MYWGPPLPPLVVGVEDPVTPHAHGLVEIVGSEALQLRGEDVTLPHKHAAQDVEVDIWTAVLWNQVLGG